VSKIIASAAIRGAHSIFAKTEAKLAQAKESFGADHVIELPNTGYFLPVIYGLTGEKVEKPRHGLVLGYARDFCLSAEREAVLPIWAPRSTPADAALRGVHEAIKYVDGRIR
jgi:acetyl-CoA synthase